MKYKAFVINMKESTERLSHMTTQLNSLGINFEVQEGVSGKTFDFTGIYNKDLSKKRNNGHQMTLGEIGCALSHRKVLEKMIQENLDYVLVMEDDIELSKNFKNIVETEIDKREKNKTKWEYLSFNYPSVGWKSIALWLFLFSNMMKDNKKKILYWIKIPIYFVKFFIFSIICIFEGLREFLYIRIYKYGKPCRFYRPLYLAGCYLINKAAAKKLLDLNKDLSYAADRLPNIARIKKGLKFYAFVPLTARQKRETFPSILNNRHFSKKVISY